MAEPSPKSHTQLVTPALDGVASKITVFVPLGIEGSVGEKVKSATISLEVDDTVIVLEVVDVCPRSLVTVSVTVYVSPRK